VGDLYRRLLHRYRPLRPTRSGNRYSRESNYHPTPARYHSSSEDRPRRPESTITQPAAKRRSNSFIELQAYEQKPDVESLLKELERRYEERLNQRILEMIEERPDKAHVEPPHNDPIENLPNEESRDTTAGLTYPERPHEENQEHDIDAGEEGVQDIGEASQKIPEASIDKTAEDDEANEMPTDRTLEVADEMRPQAQDSASTNDVEWTQSLELIDSGQNVPIEHPEETAAALGQATESVEGKMLEDPLVIADIEVLLDELEVEDLESEKEQVESGY
jgi:hypothetical protein